jgi:hypothetical protein
MTLVDRLPGPHATARSRLMAKRKVPFPDGGADEAHINMYTYTNIQQDIRSYIRSFIHTYMHTFIHTYKR